MLSVMTDFLKQNARFHFPKQNQSPLLYDNFPQEFQDKRNHLASLLFRQH